LPRIPFLGVSLIRGCYHKASNLHVIAVSTPFTRAGLHALDDLDPRWLVDDPDDLLPLVTEAFRAI
jgi:hypothetical protein